MKEIICTVNDTVSTYRVEKEISDDMISVVVYYTSKGKDKEKKRIQYKNVGEEYQSPFLNWYNVLFCNGDYNMFQDAEYLQRAVQEGKKTAATVYINPNTKEGRNYMRSLPKDCSALPYMDSMIYVFHKGCLFDFFDYEKIKALYLKYGAFNIDWNRIERYFKEDLSYFGDIEKCGFSLQSGGDKTQTIITGLLLGYPIESTVDWLGLK